MTRFVIVTVTAAAIIVGLWQARSSSELNPVEPGDTVLVTGSSSGIGKHAALSLAKEGYTVFCGVRKTKDGDAFMESAKHFGIDSKLIKILILDVTKSDDIQQAVTVVSGFVGDRGLKGLFNNAGVVGDPSINVVSTAVEHQDMDNVKFVYEVNVFGLMEVTSAFLSLLRGGKGRIVNNASVAGFIGNRFVSAYASSKHAVEGFSDSLRRELVSHGVQVSVLECGFVATPILGAQIPPGKSPYIEEEQAFWRSFWKGAIAAPSPKVSSEAVVHAMRAKEPNIRHVVGKDSGIIKVLRYLPASWLDNMLLSDLPKATDEELAQIADSSGAGTEYPP